MKRQNFSRNQIATKYHVISKNSLRSPLNVLRLNLTQNDKFAPVRRRKSRVGPGLRCHLHLCFGYS